MRKDEREDFFNGTFELKNVGRAKIGKTVQIKTERDFFMAIKPHLMSSDLSYVFDTETKDGEIFAGGRPVGTFKKVKQA